MITSFLFDSAFGVVDATRLRAKVQALVGWETRVTVGGYWEIDGGDSAWGRRLAWCQWASFCRRRYA
ncbi:isoflavone reductase [Histoplasma ohiense]|nr:isoflavone reductase [Histoplasma ohiense (nom. inval.)]